MVLSTTIVNSTHFAQEEIQTASFWIHFCLQGNKWQQLAAWTWHTVFSSRSVWVHSSRGTELTTAAVYRISMQVSSNNSTCMHRISFSDHREYPSSCGNIRDEKI